MSRTNKVYDEAQLNNLLSVITSYGMAGAARSNIVQITRMPVEDLTKMLVNLTKRGTLRTEGQKKGTRYFVVKNE